MKSLVSVLTNGSINHRGFSPMATEECFIHEVADKIGNQSNFLQSHGYRNKYGSVYTKKYPLDFPGCDMAYRLGKEAKEMYFDEFDVNPERSSVADWDATLWSRAWLEIERTGGKLALYTIYHELWDEAFFN